MRAPNKILGAVAGISMLATTLGIGSAAFAASPTYYDIYDLTTLAQNAINGLYQAGIMNGTAPGKFSPDGVVTRAQAVKFVVNLSGVQLQYPKTPSYSDVSTGSQYYPYIETALNDGFLAGFAGSSGAFDPSAPVSRVDLAILLINALGQQSLAQSLATDSTTYWGSGKLTDLSKVPSGDLGFANAGMKLGLVPPLNASLYFPNGKVDREQLAVGLWRGLGQLQASAPASLKISQSATSVGVGQADSLTVTAYNKAGTAIPSSSLAGYTISYSVTGSNASSASVSSNGQFVASASGSYTVQASISGGVLSAPVTGTTTVGVYGAPAALQVKPASASVVADGAATDTVTVTVVDSNGIAVPNYNGTITLYDTASATKILDSSGNPTLTYSSQSVTNGVATFTVESIGYTAGATDTLTATSTSVSGTALTQGTATISTIAPAATSLSLSSSPAAVNTNQANAYTAVTVTVADQAGNEITGVPENVTLTLSGPGSFTQLTAGTPTPVTSETVYVYGSLTVNVYGEQGQSGTIQVTAAATGLTSGTLKIPAVVSGFPAKLAVTSSKGTTTTGVPYTDYTVQLEDSAGNPVTSGYGASDSIAITDNTSAVGGALSYWTVTSTGAPSAALTKNASGQILATLSDGSYTFAVETAGTSSTAPTITITDTTENYSTTVAYGYQVGSAADVVFVNHGYEVGGMSPAPSWFSNQLTGSQQAEAGGTYTYSVQVTDASGNAISQAGQTVDFSLAGNAGTTANASIDGSNAAGVNYPVPTNASGVASIQVVAGSSGQFTLDAELSGGTTVASLLVTIQPAASAITSVLAGTGAPTVTNNTPSFATSVPPVIYIGTVPSGAPTGSVANDFTLGFQPVNPVGQVTSPAETDTFLVTTSNPSVLELGTNSGTVGQYSLGSSNTLEVSASNASNGYGSVYVKGGLAGTASITITDVSNPNVPTVTETIAVQSTGTLANNGQIYHNGLPVSAANALSVTANTPVLVQVESTDAGGNPVVVNQATPFYVNDSTNGGTFLADNNGTAGAPVSVVTIPAGSYLTNVFYVNPNSESVTSGLSAALVGTSMTATATTTQTAGTSFNVTLTLLNGSNPDSFGGNSPGVTLPITISGASNSPNGAAPTLPTTATFINGSATVPVTLTNAASTTLTFTVAGLTASTGAITVSPAAAAFGEIINSKTSGGTYLNGGTAGSNPATYNGGPWGTVAAPTAQTFTDPTTEGTGKAFTLAVQLVDVFGNTVTSGSPSSVTVTLTPGTSSNSTLTPSSVSLTNGYGTFTYTTGTTAGSTDDAIAVTGTGLTSFTLDVKD